MNSSSLPPHSQHIITSGDLDGYRVVWCGKFLDGTLAVVTNDPAGLKLGWSMNNHDGERITGTLELTHTEGVTPEMQMRIVLASIKQEYEQDQLIKKTMKLKNGFSLQ